MEKCQRCGEQDYDRRTLWMACFYAMQELKLPFTSCAILGWFQQKIGEEKLNALNVSIDKFDNKKDGEPVLHQFYTLRVCKDCRADWMRTIKEWFDDKPVKDEPVGSGIFIRENGAIKEISEEEWFQRNPDREPVRVVK